MEFSLDELSDILAEMGFKNIPQDHLEHFAKDLNHLIRHDRHTQRKLQATGAFSSEAFDGKKNVTDTADRPHTVHAPIPQSAVCQGDNFEKPAIPHSQPKEEAQANGNHTSSLDRRKVVDERTWRKLKTDPVRLYGWYKAYWDLHRLKK